MNEPLPAKSASRRIVAGFASIRVPVHEWARGAIVNEGRDTINLHLSIDVHIDLPAQGRTQFGASAEMNDNGPSCPQIGDDEINSFWIDYGGESG